MRIISLNMNGIRSAFKKGFLRWLPTQKADVVCLQEIRIQPEQITEEMRKPDGMKAVFQCAEKKGYAGVGICFRKQPDRILERIGWEGMDREARFLQMDFGNLSLVSLYLPSGSSGEERQQFKFRVMEHFAQWLKERSTDGREYIICGDWNIAHREIDLKNWHGNQKNSGFLPKEREWITKVFEDLGFVDVFRKLNPGPDQYTWWSNRGQAWAKNVGWRIDYQVATPGIAKSALTESIFKDQRFSDHAPLIIDYEHVL